MPVTDTQAQSTEDEKARTIRLRSALRAARKKLRRAEQENKTLREELLSAGQMIEDLASDLERPLS
jgi:hypothetical protein